VIKLRRRRRWEGHLGRREEVVKELKETSVSIPGQFRNHN